MIIALQCIKVECFDVSKKAVCLSASRYRHGGCVKYAESARGVGGGTSAELECLPGGDVVTRL